MTIGFMTQADLLEQVKYAFDEAGIDIPFRIVRYRLKGCRWIKLKQFLNQMPSILSLIHPIYKQSLSKI